MGLRTRIVLFVLLTVFAGHLGFGLVLSAQQSDQLRNDAERHGLNVLRALAGPCAIPLATRESEQLDTILASFSVDEEFGQLEIVEIAILDAEGFVAAHTDPSVFGRRLIDPLTIEARDASGPTVQELDGERVFLSYPIESGLRWGTATAVLSLDRVEATVAGLRKKVLLSAFGVAAVVAAALYALLSVLALQPIGTLSEAVRRVSEGELGARAQVPNRSDEMALLTAGFNEMAEQIQHNTRHLEEQVAARTEQLERLARTDGLTGLANHRFLREQLAAEVERAHRYGQPLAVLMIDVDHFKVYNDTNGHPEGDAVLRRFAGILRERLRSTDLPGRYGGEEFLVIMPSTPAEAALHVAAQLVVAMRSEPFVGAAAQPSGMVTISVGGAQLTAGESAEELVQRADSELYEAKTGGRDRARFSDAA